MGMKAADFEALELLADEAVQRHESLPTVA
jgi:hypothetical protein